MNDNELDELCRRIYKNHRQALDVIWERVGNSEFFAEIADCLAKDEKWHVFYRTNRYVEFVPTCWREWLPPFGAYGGDPQYWISVLLAWKEGKLVYYIHISPMKDASKRTDFVIALRKAVATQGFKASEASKIGAKWARITARVTVVEWAEGANLDTAAILGNAKDELEKLYPKLEKLEPILKSLM